MHTHTHAHDTHARARTHTYGHAQKDRWVIVATQRTTGLKNTNRPTQVDGENSSCAQRTAGENGNCNIREKGEEEGRASRKAAVGGVFVFPNPCPPRPLMRPLTAEVLCTARELSNMTVNASCVSMPMQTRKEAPGQCFVLLQRLACGQVEQSVFGKGRSRQEYFGHKLYSFFF